jgi:hypothetical protein
VLSKAPSIDDALSLSCQSNSILTGTSWLGSRRGRQLILAIFALNAISAVLFIHFVDRPVYDDPYNIFDVHTYTTQGVSVSTIRANKNPPGPTSFAWMAVGVRLLGGDELRDARIGALVSWILLAAGILIGAPYTKFSELWYAALMVSLMFPHSAEATALVLTEGPGLLFAMLGALAWVELVSRRNVSPTVLLLGIFGGLSMGFAVTSRQYFFALLPAAMFIAFYQAWGRRLKRGALWCTSVLLSLAAASVPVAFLILIWKGPTSPGMATGTSYPGVIAGIGFAPTRPLIAAFYTAFYLLPLTAPASFQVKLSRRWRIASIALCAGLAAGCFSSAILQPGPLNTVVNFVAKGEITQSLIIGLIAAAASYNAITAALLVWDKRDAVLSCPPIMFALLTVILFVVEQVGVGGNVPFYERYVLQIAPFLGLFAFALFPRLTFLRLSIIAALLVVTQVMLWRHAFGT